MCDGKYSDLQKTFKSVGTFLHVAHAPERNAAALCLHLTDCAIWNPATPIKRRISAAVACVSIFTPQPYPTLTLRRRWRGSSIKA